MGNFIASKHQLIKIAIEHRDRNGILSLIRSSSQEQIGQIFRNELFIDGHRTTLLHYAAWQDNADLLQLILEFIDDLEVRDEHGWTPLMAAVHRGSKSNATILLEREADINCDFVQGMHLIAVAMMFHDSELIETLLNHGAKIANSNNQNPIHCYLLHFAVDEGLHDITELILNKNQIPIDTINDRGWTPLHIAVGHNRLDLVQLLIEHGAHINARDSHGNTPLTWARQFKHTEIIKELEKHNAESDRVWHGTELIDKYFISTVKQFSGENQLEIDQTATEENPIIRDALETFQRTSIHAQ